MQPTGGGTVYMAQCTHLSAREKHLDPPRTHGTSNPTASQRGLQRWQDLYLMLAKPPLGQPMETLSKNAL